MKTEALDKKIIDTNKYYDGIIRVNDVREKIKELKEELSKIMELDGYAGKIRGKKVSINIILNKIFGTLAEDNSQISQRDVKGLTDKYSEKKIYSTSSNSDPEIKGDGK